MNIVNKCAYYLSIVIKDVVTSIFLILLIVKLVIFNQNAYLGTYSFIPSLGAILILISLSLLTNSNTFKFIYLITVYISLSLIFFIQSVYISYFRDLASIYDLSHISQLTAVSSIVLELLTEKLIFIVDIPLLPLTLLCNSQIKRDLKERAYAFIILMIIGLIYNIYPIIISVNSNYNKSVYFRHNYANNMGIVNYQINDVFSYLKNKLTKKSINSSELSLVKLRLFRPTVVTLRNSFTGIGKGMNVIIIQIESLQNFVVGRKFNGRDITPNLNSLLRHGLKFHNIYDQTGDGNSSDAMFLANCSLYPAKKGAVSFLHAENNFESLPKLLAENGYSTAVLHAYHKNFWNFAKFDGALGFERQFYDRDYVIDERIGLGLSDRSFFSQSTEKIKELPAPFYVVLRTLTTHAPFDEVNKNIDDFPLGELENTTIGGYIRSMHYIDSAIGEFLHKLSKVDLLSQTVLIVYGDHRARLPEEELKKIGIHDMDEERKIPLIISSASWKLEAARDTVGGLIDVPPTLCNILGINSSGKFVLGNDLGENHTGYVIFRDGSFIAQNGSIDAASAQNELMVSDLILEKDMIPLLRRKDGYSTERFVEEHHEH